jgi:hypothetical protein
MVLRDIVCKKSTPQVRLLYMLTFSHDFFPAAKFAFIPVLGCVPTRPLAVWSVGASIPRSIDRDSLRDPQFLADLQCTLPDIRDYNVHRDDMEICTDPEERYHWP